MDDRVLAVIPARGGSKRIPRKNIVDLAGKPLIAWTFEAARAVQEIDRLIVSTDDDEIANVAKSYGVEVPFLRPAGIAGDDTPSIDVVLHVLDRLWQTERYEPDWLLLLQPTSPLRTHSDIRSILSLAQTCGNAEALVSVTQVLHPPGLHYHLQDQRLVRVDASSKAGTQRQDHGSFFAVNGALYLNRPKSLRATRTFIPETTIAYEMPPERSVDVDTLWDLQLCEWALRNPSSGRR